MSTIISSSRARPSPNFNRSSKTTQSRIFGSSWDTGVSDVGGRRESIRPYLNVGSPERRSGVGKYVGGDRLEDGHNR